MNKKFLPGSTVALKSTREQAGETTLIVESSERTQTTVSGKVRGAPPVMVVRASLLKAGQYVVHCYYYSDHLDQFVDRWLPAITLRLIDSAQYGQTPEYRQGDIVTLATALSKPKESMLLYSYSLNGLDEKRKYTIRKRFGSALLQPPVLDITKVKHHEDKTIMVCVWYSKKTGRLYEAELPPEVLVYQKDIC